MWYKNIKSYREKAGLSQRELANRIGVKQSTIASYEVGRNEPNIEKIISIARCFNISLDTLLSFTLSNDEDANFYARVCNLNQGNRFILNHVLSALEEADKQFS